MTYSFNYANPVPPSYSGVTINITNPALNMPPPYPNMVAGACVPYQGQAINGGVNLPQGVNAIYGPYPQSVNMVPYSTNPYQQYPQQLIAPEGSADYIYGTIPQNNYYGQPFENQAYAQIPENMSTDPIHGDYNSGTQNINNTNIYQLSPTDNSGLPEAYPQQYYITGNSQSTPSNNAPQVASIIPENNSYEEANTEKSQEIIDGLNERQAQEKALEQNSKKTKVVSLTNEYIMSLENYLNNPNTDIRLMAAKEILTRLDEDKSRYDDAALNALINKMLQDPNKLVRIAAMSALSSELASGNDYTVELLTRIQQNPEADPEDVLEASQILLKRASSTEIKYTPVYNQQQAEEQQ